MHPLLARYLDLDTTLATIDRIDRHEELSPDERALAVVLRRAPEQKRAVLDARGRSRPDDPAQQALVYLAANAAVERLREDPAGAAALTRADLSLRTHGASDAQVAAFLATVLVEEAFGYEDEADDFDLPLVLETFEGVPALAGLDADKVERLREKLAETVPQKSLEAARRAFDALVEAAWSEGPEPINPEHALEAASGLEDPNVRDQLENVLRSLAASGLVGPRRLARLLERLEEAG